MTAVHRVAKRTFAALAFGFPTGNTALSPMSRLGGTLSGVAPSSSERTSTKLFSTNFRAPEPPQSKGWNVFEDIDLSVANRDRSESSIRNSDPGAVFLVNGASRGIGLQFVQQLVETTQGQILAGCRSPETATQLQKLASGSDGRIEVIQLDIQDQDSIERAGETIRLKYNRLDMLLNVAGLLGDGKTTAGPERSVSKIEREWMETTFQVNVIGPVMLTKELAPLMTQRRRKSKDDETPPGRAVGVVANLSARVGSISDNGLGGWYSYRMSKSALNQATRTLANELKRQSVWCVSLHPGTTDTDLSKPFQANVQKERLFPVEFTVDSLMKVIDSMDESNSGGLYDWAGKAIPF